MNTTEYVVMRNGYYLQETDKPGVYLQVNDLDKATTFQSLESVVSYIEMDLGLNIRNVAIKKLDTVTTISTLVTDYKGDLVDIKTVEQCATCGKWFPFDMLTLYQYDKTSTVEYYCDEHYEEMDNKYPNALDDLFGNPVEKLGSIFNIRGGK